MATHHIFPVWYIYTRPLVFFRFGMFYPKNLATLRQDGGPSDTLRREDLCFQMFAGDASTADVLVC
jgi:hypothetical protein